MDTPKTHRERPKRRGNMERANLELACASSQPILGPLPVELVLVRVRLQAATSPSRLLLAVSVSPQAALCRNPSLIGFCSGKDRRDGLLKCQCSGDVMHAALSALSPTKIEGDFPARVTRPFHHQSSPSQLSSNLCSLLPLILSSMLLIIFHLLVIGRTSISAGPILLFSYGSWQMMNDSMI